MIFISKKTFFILLELLLLALIFKFMEIVAD